MCGMAVRVWLVAGEHDECEGGFGGVEAVGAVDHRAVLIVESLVASVAQFQVDRGDDAVPVGADRAGTFDEFRDTRSLRAGTPAIQHDMRF